MRPTRLAALSLMIALAACQQSPAKQDAPAAAPEGKPGMALSGGRLVLPAVKGNPGAVYFSVFNGGDKEVSLVAVAIEGAGNAEMHSNMRDVMAKIDAVSIKPSWTERFYPGGRHVMAFDLDPKLAPGGKSEITLTFADGDKLSAPLVIETVGQAAMGAEHDH